jgi:hypothetical protein
MYRILKCPASIRLQEANSIPNTTNASAEFGTKCHGFADKVLKGQVAVEEVPTDVLESIQDYVKFVWSVKAFLDDQVIVHTADSELRMWTEMPDVWGTTDYVIVTENEAWIIDLKTGAKLVSPEENAQMMTYALNLLITTKVNKFNLVIVQSADVDNPVKIWTTTRERLVAFELEVRQAVSHIPFAAPVMGDWCMYAKCVSVCPAHAEAAVAVFEDAPVAALRATMTDEQKLFIIRNQAAIRRYLTVIYAEALRSPPIGYKLVAGPSRRKWADDTEHVVSTLTSLGVGPRVVPPTITEATKALGGGAKAKAALNGLTKMCASKPVLAPLDDRRAALNVSATVFEDEEEDVDL